MESVNLAVQPVAATSHYLVDIHKQLYFGYKLLIHEITVQSFLFFLRCRFVCYFTTANVYLKACLLLCRYTV